MTCDPDILDFLSNDKSTLQLFDEPELDPPSVYNSGRDCEPIVTLSARLSTQSISPSSPANIQSNPLKIVNMKLTLFVTLALVFAAIVYAAPVKTKKTSIVSTRKTIFKPSTKTLSRRHHHRYGYGYGRYGHGYGYGYPYYGYGPYGGHGYGYNGYYGPFGYFGRRGKGEIDDDRFDD